MNEDKSNLFVARHKYKGINVQDINQLHTDKVNMDSIIVNFAIKARYFGISKHR